jgi:hypothetical protein
MSMYTEKILIAPIKQMISGPFISPMIRIQNGNWTMVYLIIELIICNIVINIDLNVFNSNVLIICVDFLAIPLLKSLTSTSGLFNFFSLNNCLITTVKWVNNFINRIFCFWFTVIKRNFLPTYHCVTSFKYICKFSI